ncbi:MULTISPECIES: prepilin-type N-terminal cleavage/methylation domain-containing protein [Nitrincola]|uniref:Pullulanase secretion protein pulG n=1 Tax=Nitrincola nitratireducens TaxID=1229521 RepID=W9V0Z9_9GAMM|nr:MULTISPECIES: prepilin-type N-terminal cleavage/methylation domain-containing protein [Nitrincola]EXJ13153.1 Pullulanase secretion protein pulG [Nitrincola nitratireducens]
MTHYKAFLQKLKGFSLIELLITVAILGVLASIAIPGYQRYKERVDNHTAITDLQVISAAIERYYILNRQFPGSLNQLNLSGDQLQDPWGAPYQYLDVTIQTNKGKVRKDKNLVPINNDFDLYSMGKDGRSASPLTSALSRDDIIRANNGNFYGLASDY